MQVEVEAVERDGAVDETSGGKSEGGRDGTDAGEREGSDLGEGEEVVDSGGIWGSLKRRREGRSQQKEIEGKGEEGGDEGELGLSSSFLSQNSSDNLSELSSTDL